MTINSFWNATLSERCTLTNLEEQPTALERLSELFEAQRDGKIHRPLFKTVDQIDNLDVSKSLRLILVCEWSEIWDLGLFVSYSGCTMGIGQFILHATN